MDKDTLVSKLEHVYHIMLIKILFSFCLRLVSGGIVMLVNNFSFLFSALFQDSFKSKVKDFVQRYAKR